MSRTPALVLCALPLLACAPAARTDPAPGPAPAATQPAAQQPAAAPQAPPQTQPAPTRGTVEGVVEQVRRAEEPLPPAVREPVQPVLDTVQQVGRTVDEVTGPLLPVLP
jgi:hypothetical protein